MWVRPLIRSRPRRAPQQYTELARWLAAGLMLFSVTETQYKDHYLVGSELVKRLVYAGVFANPHMLGCRPALQTASSWERCQRRNARWPEHALAESRFDQLLSGLGRIVHHSQSVKGGGASSPVSKMSIPSWCHRNHPSTAPPALGR